jgi:AraC-like DNA-binding protein
MLMRSLDETMKDKELFRDSNLTLARVARRLSVPTRDLSGATNRVTGENFSRLINGYRIAYARRALLETDLPVTEVMFEAGFLSKSSFNTEFRRVAGLTPSQFRAGGTDQ